MFANLIADIRYSLRGFAARPMFMLVAVLTLALGIGANTAIFSLFQQMLLRPLPVPQPGELVLLSSPGPRQGAVSTGFEGGDEFVFSHPMWRDLQASSEARDAFTGIAGHRSFEASLAYQGRTRIGEGVMVSGNYFSVLGLTPALGRLFTPEDDAAPGAAPVAVLSHAYWRNEFGGDSGVLDRTLMVNGQALTIVGVAPEGFGGLGLTLGGQPQVFVPIALAERVEPNRLPRFEERRSYWIYLFARLRPVVSAEQAASAINVPYRAALHDVEAPLQSGVSDSWLARFKGQRIELLPGARGQSILPGEVRQSLTLLLAVTGLVLLVACVNVANLLLARGAARAGEIAVRSAIGASRRRLAGQLLVESGLLALLGGLVSLPVALGTLRLITTSMPGELGQAFETGLEPALAGFALAVAMATVLIFGLVPAVQVAGMAPVSVIRGQAGRSSGSRGATRFRTALATTQIGFSMALLVLAGLFIQSLANVGRIDLGMRVERVVSFRIAPGRIGYEPTDSKALYERLEERLAAMPGVTAVSASLVPLLTNSNWDNNVSVEGFDAGPDTDANAHFNAVGPDFFTTLSISLLAGRAFEPADALGRPKVVVVNEAFAEKFGLGRDVVGKRMARGRGGELDMEIIGLVADARYSQVKDAAPPQFFLPWRQLENLGDISFYVRTGIDVDPVMTAIPGIVAELDPNLPVDQLNSMRVVVGENVFLDKFIGVLSGAFAALATALAAVGLYSVLSFALAQRTRELGLRLALGAAPAALRGMILRQVGTMAAIGGGLGLIAALGLGRAAQSLLFGLDAFDLRVTAAAALVLGLVVLLAGYQPARRAARTDPIEALRYE